MGLRPFHLAHIASRLDSISMRGGWYLQRSGGEQSSAQRRHCSTTPPALLNACLPEATMLVPPLAEGGGGVVDGHERWQAVLPPVEVQQLLAVLLATVA